MKFVFCLSAAVLLPASVLAQQTSHHNGKISPDVETSSDSASVAVIVQYKQDPGVDAEDRISKLGATSKDHLHSIRSMVVHVPASQLDALASDDAVAYISPDRALGARQQGVVVTAPEYTTEPINANAVWSDGIDGTGVGVAVIDSGINAVDDLSSIASNERGDKAAPANRIVYSANFVPGQTTTADLYGHGTHVAGLIAGNGAHSTGPTYARTFSGVAPNANLINLRVLDANGNGTDSSVIEAIERAISLKKKYNIKIINLSLGRPIWESYALDPLCQAVEQAYQAGITVVVAAGNQGRNLSMNPEGYGTIEAPGNDPYVITVGAMKTMGTSTPSDDLIASYSSKGPSFIDHIAKPDLVAPGNLVPSLKFPADPLSVNNPSLVTLNAWYINRATRCPALIIFR